MKLENFQTHITNPQFSGGRPIGSGSTGNTSFASASLVFAGIANTTGSFKLTDQFGVVDTFILTASNQVDANASTTDSVFYISISGSTTAANKVTAIASYLNASASAVVSATAATTNLVLTSSINGTAGNNVSILSGSTTTNLAGGSGTSDYPYTFPFVAGGLYVGQAGSLVTTTIDGSQITFVSASGFIPGLFQAVDKASTATFIVALK